MDNKFIPYASRKYVDSLAFGNRQCIKFEDVATGYSYAVFIENGEMVIALLFSSLEYNGEPIDVYEGNRVDLEGIEINMVFPDGTVTPFTDYENLEVVGSTYPESGDTEVELTYNCFDTVFSCKIPVNVTPFNPEVDLIDFTYIDNGDGTYTITDWKGTLNGEPSTKIVFPNNNKVIL